MVGNSQKQGRKVIWISLGVVGGLVAVWVAVCVIDIAYFAATHKRLLSPGGSSTVPPDESGEQILRQQLTSVFDSSRKNNEEPVEINLVSFRKTNGQSLVRDGVPCYKMDYEAEIEFREDGWHENWGAYKNKGFHLYAKQVKKGQREKLSG